MEGKEIGRVEFTRSISTTKMNSPRRSKGIDSENKQKQAAITKY
jgi:hypothetical protein